MEAFNCILIFLLCFNSVWFIGLVVYVIKLFYEVQNLRRNNDYYSNRQVRAIELNNDEMSFYLRRLRDKNGNDTL